MTLNDTLMACRRCSVWTHSWGYTQIHEYISDCMFWASNNVQRLTLYYQVDRELLVCGVHKIPQWQRESATCTCLFCYSVCDNNSRSSSSSSIVAMAARRRTVCCQWIIEERIVFSLQAKHHHRSILLKLDYCTRRFPADTKYITLHSIRASILCMQLSSQVELVLFCSSFVAFVAHHGRISANSNNSYW